MLRLIGETGTSTVNAPEDDPTEFAWERAGAGTLPCTRVPAAWSSYWGLDWDPALDSRGKRRILSELPRRSRGPGLCRRSPRAPRPDLCEVVTSNYAVVYLVTL